MRARRTLVPDGLRMPAMRASSSFWLSVSSYLRFSISRILTVAARASAETNSEALRHSSTSGALASRPAFMAWLDSVRYSPNTLVRSCTATMSSSTTRMSWDSLLRSVSRPARSARAGANFS